MTPHTNQRDTTIGKGMLWIAALALLAGFTYLFHVVSPGRGGVTSTTDEGGRAMVVLQRDRSGHYLAEGAINGQPVRFLVDTGATDVAVSESMARALGLDFGPEVVVMTAAGPAGAWLTRLDRVSVGHLSVTGVRATITPALGDEALLGMSFLKHFTIRQEGETLAIADQGGRDA